MKNTCFAQLSEQEKEGRLAKVILQKAENSLDAETVKEIVGQLDCEQQYSIVVTENPDTFIKMITLKSFSVKGQAKAVITIEKGIKLLGNLSFGLNKKFRYGRYECGKTVKGALNNICNPAAAFVHTENIGCDDFSLPLTEDRIIIYLPKSIQCEKAG